MIEYNVRRVDAGGPGDIERVCNELASEGWRLVSTAATTIDAPVLLFFERETGDGPALQDTWRAQHGGQDAG
jgi:hypothetical protein